MIKGLEDLYDPNKKWSWNPTFEGPDICLDPWGKLEGFTFNGVFDGSCEIQVAEQLYALVSAAAANALSRNAKTFYAIETGTCDSYSSCFIAKALDNAGIGHLWTGELCDKRSTGTARPWPGLWRDLGLLPRITACVGDTRNLDTWTDKHHYQTECEFPKSFDFAFLDSEHDRATLLPEWRLVKPWLRPGAIVAFHDTLIYPEVRQVAEEISDEVKVKLTEGRSFRGFSYLQLPDDFDGTK